MDRVAIFGATAGMAAGGTLTILAIAVVTDGGLEGVLGFAGGIVLVGALLVLLASVRE
jgi:hypothetical protein